MKLEQINTIGEVFAKGFKAQMLEETTVELGLAVGIMQGLKYNGSLKRGLVSGLVTMGVVSTTSGVRTVAKNWKAIKSNLQLVED